MDSHIADSAVPGLLFFSTQINSEWRSLTNEKDIQLLVSKISLKLAFAQLTWSEVKKNNANKLTKPED